MHDHDENLVDLALAMARHELTTTKPLRSPEPAAAIYGALDGSINDQGLGAARAVELMRDVVGANCMNVSSPNVFAFIPSSATQASLAADVILTSMNAIGDWWLEGAGAIAAENTALAWLCAEIGLGEQAGGVFVSGATPGNLAALAAARRWWRSEHREHTRDRLAIACAQQAHSSVRMVASVLDCDVLLVDGDEYGRLRAGDLVAALAAHDAAGGAPVFAISATAGTTNLGMVDDLAGLAQVARQQGLWLHVDGAYGGAAVLSSTGRAALAGIEAVHSMVVDPHKWLFAGYDSCALLYRDARIARAAFTQTAEYLEAVEVSAEEWNPSDYAVHLTRRARGVPLWFSLATNGVDAYRAAVDTCLSLAREFTAAVQAAPHLELFAPTTLSIVTFTRPGWQRADYERWSRQHLAAGEFFIAVSEFRGEPMLRVCLVHPRTTMAQLQVVIDSLE
ncbi:MAG: pyridoxal-dependent decarboxylase [Ilumatobacteraceae bacterium]